MSLGRTGFLAVCFLAFIVVGVGLERVRQAVLAPAPLEPAHGVALREGGAPVEADALRRRVVELERDLAASRAEPLARRAPDGPPPGEQEDRRPLYREPRRELPRGEGLGRSAEEFRRLEQQEERLRGFLVSVDTQGLSAEQREVHERLARTLAIIAGLRLQRALSGAEPGSQADDAFREQLREPLSQLGPLLEQERASLLEQAARAAGCEGAAASELARRVQDVIQNTVLPGYPREGGPAGPGGPPHAREP